MSGDRGMIVGIRGAAADDRQSVTLVVPNFNHAQFLRKALSGVLGQSRLPERIVIVDDASTDGSLDLIRALVLGRTGGTIDVVANAERIGVVAIMNREIARCQTKYIAFLAADDCIEPDFLARSLAALAASPQAGFSCGCVSLRDGEWRAIGVRPAFRPRMSTGFVEADTFRGLLGRGDNFFLGASVLYLHAGLAALGGFDPALGAASDAIVQRRLAARFGFCFIAETIASWRVHGANYSLREQQAIEGIDRMIAAAIGTIAREPEGLFPHGYPEVLANRMRFGIARQAVALRGATDDLLDWLPGVLKRRRSRAIGAIRRLPPALRRYPLLVWLTLTMRPFSLAWLVGEALARPGITRSDRAG